MKKWLIAALLIACLAVPAAGQKTVLPLDAATTRQLDSLFDYLQQAKLFNGNVLVASAGQAFYTRSVGLGNVATGEPLVAGSVFELASVSKQFTATGILQLVAHKKLRLDQDVQQLLPDLPYKGITVRHLLNHTSGLPDYMSLFSEHWDSTKIATNKDLVPMLRRYKPEVLFAPGAEWRYSNTGYALLACIIERVSGKSFATYMKEQVFRPLHLEHTFIYSRRLAPQKIDHYALGYMMDDDHVFKLPDTYPYQPAYYLDGIQGDGTVNTTSGDMLTWNNAVVARKLLPAALWDEMLTPVTPANGKPSGYGFGFELVEKPELGKIIRHSGGWMGYNTYNNIYSAPNTSFVILCNMEQDPSVFEGTVTAVKNIMQHKAYTLPAPFVARKAVEIDRSVYTSYAGTYNLADGFDLVVSTKDGRLYVSPTGQGTLEILPASPVRFFVADFPVEFEFQQPVNGRSDKLTLYQNGQALPAIRK